MSDVMPQAPTQNPFVTVMTSEQSEEITTNLPPTQRPLILWLLERAKMIVLTQASEQEKSSKLVKPNGVGGLLRRMGKA